VRAFGRNIVPLPPPQQQPESTLLYPNFPNPFNGITHIKYFLKKPGHVKLQIVNRMGRIVKILTDDRQNAGTHNLTWDGSDTMGFKSASGLYLLALRTNDEVRVRKVLYLK
jgi:hypothetical protein